MRWNFQRNIMSMFSRRKKLIIGGCSYTDNYAKKHKMPEFPIWGELLADKLDMDLINLGRCGFGNQAIYTTILERTLKEKNVGLIVAMWSEVQRLNIYKNTQLNPKWQHYNWQCFHPERIVLDAEWHDQFYKPPSKNPKKSGLQWDVSNVYRDYDIDCIKGATISSLSFMYSFQNFCEANDVPYLQVQGCQPLMGKSEPTQNIQYKEFCNLIINSPYVDKIKDTFLGWPIDPRIGGYSIDSKLEDEHRFAPEDTHPNEIGHKFISEVLYNAINSKWL